MTSLQIEVQFDDKGRIRASIIHNGEKIGVASASMLGKGLATKAVRKKVEKFHADLGMIIMGLVRKDDEAPVIIDPSSN